MANFLAVSPPKIPPIPVIFYWSSKAASYSISMLLTHQSTPIYALLEFRVLVV
ncbi:MAG: hypothetical protein P8H52_00520 [Porticoccaceae bacterium]|nr:hypothetical protein [Porticoccaceae bacterium]MDC0053635.1 hypothetical protein [Gammaproteobacteria bacterium]MDG1782048.1 hypothetical protein [Porticoccaceae bacterium]